MRSIAQSTSCRKPIRHYALLTIDGVDCEGVATLVQGGWLFQPDGTARARLVAYNSPLLTLLGNKTLADAQYTRDRETA